MNPNLVLRVKAPMLGACLKHLSIHGQTANDVRSGRGSSTPIWASPRSPAQPLLPQDEPERERLHKDTLLARFWGSGGDEKLSSTRNRSLPRHASLRKNQRRKGEGELHAPLSVLGWWAWVNSPEQVRAKVRAASYPQTFKCTHFAIRSLISAHTSTCAMSAATFLGARSTPGGVAAACVVIWAVAGGIGLLKSGCLPEGGGGSSVRIFHAACTEGSKGGRARSQREQERCALSSWLLCPRLLSACVRAPAACKLGTSACGVAWSYIEAQFSHCLEKFMKLEKKPLELVMQLVRAVVPSFHSLG
eukprot:1160924-Pelagomonas_calceolata.AAC.6